jgi:hypothetical protein
VISRTPSAALFLSLVLAGSAIADTVRLVPDELPVPNFVESRIWRNSMPEQSQVSDAPRLDADDQLTVQETAKRTAVKVNPDSPAGLATNALSLMSASGPHAESNYQAALRALARQPDAAVAAVTEMYRAAPEDQYITRWAQVQLLSDLRDSAALEFFQSILAAPIPPEKAPDMITYSTVGEEVMLKTTAIEGITRLATTGDRRALELLREYAEHEVLSIKRAAVQGYVEAVGPKGREELRKILKKQDHFILDIRRTEVQKVPQPRPDRPSTTKDEPPPARLAPPTVEE